MSTLESQIAYGKEFLKKKDTQINEKTAQINKLEREKKFLQQSHESPTSHADRSNKSLEVAFKKLEREYEAMARNLNAERARGASAVAPWSLDIKP